MKYSSKAKAGSEDYFDGWKDGKMSRKTHLMRKGKRFKMFNKDCYNVPHHYILSSLNVSYHYII